MNSLKINKDKKVILKSGNNKMMIISTIVFIIIIIIFATTGLWMKDERKIMSRNNDVKLSYNKMSVQVPKDFYYDEELRIGEITFVENFMINDVNDNTTYKFSLSNGINYGENTLFIDKGTCIVDVENENRCNRGVLIQFVVPEDIDYLKVSISQAEGKSELVELDITNFSEKKISEKTSGYMASLDVYNAQIAELEKQRNPFLKKVEGLEKTIASLETEIKTVNTTINAITDEKVLSEKKAIVEQKQKDLEASKKSFDENKKIISDFDIKLAKIIEEMKVIE